MNFNIINQKRLQTKKKLMNRELIFGGWVSYRDPSIAETFAMSGLDFIGIDMEHTTISLDDANRIITSCHSENTLCFPRPVSHNNDYIKPLLEAGSDGAIIQMIETKEHVKDIISKIKFPPQGNRSYGVNRAHGYGIHFKDYINTWNNSSILILQIESMKAVENIDAITDCEGIDGIMIGPYDISGSIGFPGELEHPLVKKAEDKILEMCERKGISCATQFSEISKSKILEVLNRGYTFCILSSDLFILTDWSSNTKKIIKLLQESKIK
tara:strand:+ start:290 stop:1096 length:807 start_codon:yes stop_codon:yes gene_type:complete